LWIIASFAAFCFAGDGVGTKAEQVKPEFEARQIDLLTRVFPDRSPDERIYTEPIHVPRGAKACFQFVVKSDMPVSCSFILDAIRGRRGQTLLVEPHVYRVLTIHVEGNSQGCMKTYPSSACSPERFASYIVRKAPFDMAEVLEETETLDLKAGVYHSVLIEIPVTDSARPDEYEGTLQFKAGSNSTVVPFKFIVHKTKIAGYSLDSNHWLWSTPSNLALGVNCKYYSEQHWQLIEHAGRLLKDYGNNYIMTPLVGSMPNQGLDVPLVQTYVTGYRKYEFDFSRFERWCNLFFSLGYNKIEGAHVSAGGPLLVNAIDKKANKEIVLFKSSSDVQEYFAFLDVFFQELHKVLQKNRWTTRYVQHLMDEPAANKVDEYLALNHVFRNAMPGVDNIEAILNKVYLPYVDIPALHIQLMDEKQGLISPIIKNGNSIWFYQSCNPVPPYANRWLDLDLSNNRLYPWLAYLLNADGYLFWAANGYRGADPYTSSIGPLPSGSQNPGHPVGDNWLFYPGPDGLRGSMRAVAFRDGLVDHTLLKMLQKKNPKSADTIMKVIAKSVTDFERRPHIYHESRKKILSEIENH